MNSASDEGGKHNDRLDGWPRLRRGCVWPRARWLRSAPADISLIPWPASLELTGGSLTLEPQTQIVVDGDARVRVVAHYFGDLIERSRGLRPVIVQGTAQDAPKRAVVFTLGGR